MNRKTCSLFIATISDEYSVISNLDLQCEYQRAQCVALSNAGFSCHEATKVIAISKSSVQCAIKRFEETGDFHHRQCSGRLK